MNFEIIIGMKIGYIHKEVREVWLQEAREISLMLSGLIQKKTAFVEKVRNLLLFLIG